MEALMPVIGGGEVSPVDGGEQSAGGGLGSGHEGPGLRGQPGRPGEIAFGKSIAGIPRVSLGGAADEDEGFEFAIAARAAEHNGPVRIDLVGAPARGAAQGGIGGHTTLRDRR